MLHCPTVLAAPAVRVCMLTFLLSEPFWEMHWTTVITPGWDPGVRNWGRLRLLHPEFGSHSNHRHAQNTNLCLHVQAGRHFWFSSSQMLLGCLHLACQCCDICWCCSELVSALGPPAVFLVRNSQSRAQKTPLISVWLHQKTPLISVWLHQKTPLNSVWLHPQLIHIFFSCHKILFRC